jgi:hypothetical protein
MKAIVLSAKIPIRRPSLRRGFFLISLVLVCFGLAPLAQAAGPDTDGNILGSNNGEGIGVLVSRTTGVWNTGTGFEALNHLTAGNQNTATGLRALNSDINGGFNTATGVYSLFSNTGGFFNSATGAYSLANNISGGYNTANGYSALYFNAASYNTATGFAALYRNTTGGNNTANGYQALLSNTIGSGNTATGVGALYRNIEGELNTAIGVSALSSNTYGTDNTASGFAALSHATASGNTATGSQALENNTTGHGNTAHGAAALYSNTTGSFNTALGIDAGFGVTTADHVICIGDDVLGANVANSCFIGNIYSNVQPIVGTDPDSVTINSSGRLGRGNVSSRRYKHDIKPMDRASEALFALKPVSFRYNKQYDASQTLAFGLIAEEVAEVYPDLVGRNAEGQPESVRYEQINAMLLNEFIKEHRKVEQQETAITELRSNAAKQEATIVLQQHEIKALTASLKEQSAQIQKVSAQLETTEPASRMVNNNQ